jgi:periplasmic divalent cation tolerance protein
MLEINSQTLLCKRLISGYSNIGDWDWFGICDLVIGISMSGSIVVLVTCGSEEEALTIARALVDDHLAACVNLVSPIRSIYRWEGKIWDEKEWLLIIKTQGKKFGELKTRVKALHSYAVPEIISLPIVEGSSSYLRWLEEMTQK